MEVSPSSDILDRIEQLSKKYDRFFRIHRSTMRGAPLLKGGNYSAFLKPVLKKYFDFAKDDIEKYSPDIQLFLPMVMFEMTLTDDSTFSFQLDVETFDHFFDDIVALRIELTQVMKAMEAKDESK